jgi:hypothetical protein
MQSPSAIGIPLRISRKQSFYQQSPPFATPEPLANAIVKSEADECLLGFARPNAMHYEKLIVCLH